MNFCHARTIVVLASFLGTAAAAPQDNPNLQEQVRRSTELNEKLERLLDQTRRELQELREEVNQLRARVAAPPPAETPSSAAPNADLPNRLMRMEDQVEINASQIKEQAQTKVESDSRFNVRLFGTVLYNTFYNTHDAAEDAVPTAAPARSAPVAYEGGNFGATLRQTSFGFAMTGPRVGDARLSASVDFDFYGGTPGVYGSDVLGALRMRTAVARLEGRANTLTMGLMEPMISPLSPTSLAAVYYPALGDSGNLWQWLPQTMVEHRIPVNASDSLIVQGGVMIPSGENFDGKGLEGRPGYELRTAFSRKLDPERRVEVGIGGYIHPQRFGYDRGVHSYAVTGDWVIPLNRRLEVSGEAYYGQSITLKAPSGADISSLFGFRGGLDDPRGEFWGIHSAGGWVQLHAEATPRLEFNAAYGTDDPRNRDIFAGLFNNTARLGNRTFSLNSIYQLRSNFLLALEYRRLTTVYPDVRSANGHFNIAVGYLF